MSLPSDILLPSNSKYLSFVNSKYKYNTNYDITWSFSFCLTGQQHGFTTFFTTTSSLCSGLPGQYLGYGGYFSYINDEMGQILQTESSEDLYTENFNDSAGIYSIAFDTTGLFALSSDYRSGVGYDGISSNSIIIRNNNNDLSFNSPISSISDDFFITSNDKNWQTLRFRYANNGSKLYIDYKSQNYEKYKNLVTTDIEFDTTSYPYVYIGFSFCSPISSSSITPSTLFLKNFHIQGEMGDVTTEYVEFKPLSSSIRVGYTTLTGISAYPKY